jgi:hypothetical protein
LTELLFCVIFSQEIKSVKIQTKPPGSKRKEDIVKFGILECRGFEGKHAPTRAQVTDILQPLLLERGWKTVSFVRVEGVATFVSLNGVKGAMNLDGVQAELVEYCREREEKERREGRESRDYPQLSLGSGVEVVAAFMESTDNDNGIFAAMVLQAQLEAIPLAAEKAKEELRELGEQLSAT